MKLSDGFAQVRKAVAGAAAAGLGALVVAIQETTQDGVVVDPAFHVTTAEWTSVVGAVVAALSAVYAVRNRTPKDEAEVVDEPILEGESLEENKPV